MEAECKPMLNTGLRGVVIADTRISDVQGAAGKSSAMCRVPPGN